MTDTRQFYPMMDRMKAMDIIDGIIEHCTQYEQLAAWDHVVQHRLHLHLQGRIGRQVAHMIEHGMLSDRQEHRGFCKVELDDICMVETIPYDTDQSEFGNRLESIFPGCNSYTPIPHAECSDCEDDGEYYIKHHSEPISQYVDLGSDGVLIGCKDYWVGYKHKGLRVYQELTEDDFKREYICLDNEIIYLDTLEKGELP